MNPSEGGDERRKLMVHGQPGEIMARLTRLIGESGARSFEFGFLLDGPDQEREPLPGEVVTWFAEVVRPDGGKVRREVRSSDYHAGPVTATADLLVALGASVAILDNRE